MAAVTNLTIIYDASCGLCTRTKEWIGEQAPLVGLHFTASSEAGNKFPRLPAGELAVVANTGEVWSGNHAWIVCLWALRDYRDLAVRLSSPFLLMMAREAFAIVSRNRSALSRLLNLRSERELEEEIRGAFVPKCETDPK